MYLRFTQSRPLHMVSQPSVLSIADNSTIIMPAIHSTYEHIHYVSHEESSELIFVVA
jgi:hypothetical protein